MKECFYKTFNKYGLLYNLSVLGNHELFFFFEGTSCVVASKYGTADVVFLKAMVTLCMWDVLMCK